MRRSSSLAFPCSQGRPLSHSLSMALRPRSRGAWQACVLMCVCVCVYAAAGSRPFSSLQKRKHRHTNFQRSSCVFAILVSRFCRSSWDHRRPQLRPYHHLQTHFLKCLLKLKPVRYRQQIMLNSSSFVSFFIFLLQMFLITDVFVLQSIM